MDNTSKELAESISERITELLLTETISEEEKLKFMESASKLRDILVYSNAQRALELIDDGMEGEDKITK